MTNPMEEPIMPEPIGSWGNPWPLDARWTGTSATTQTLDVVLDGTTVPLLFPAGDGVRVSDEEHRQLADATGITWAQVPT